MSPQLDSPINRNYVKLFGGQFEGLNFVGYLNTKLSCWQYNKELDVRILEKLLMSESLDDWKRISNGLTASSSVSPDEIAAGVNHFICHILDWKKKLYSFFLKHFDHCWVFYEVCDVFLFFSLGF